MTEKITTTVQPSASTPGPLGADTKSPEHASSNSTESTEDPQCGQAVHRRGTGPRTARGKERSKLNALKHGLFSKHVLLRGESRVEYLSLLNELQEDLEPQGKLENVLVENLAELFWRKRRLLQAENAEVSERIEFTTIDFVDRQYVQAWECSRASIASGGLLKHIYNPIVLREAKGMLMLFREVLIKRGFRKDSPILKRLYGQTEDGELTNGLRWLYEDFARTVEKSEKGDNRSEEARLKELIIPLIDSEIERLREEQIARQTLDQQRFGYKSLAAIVPGPMVSDRLIRCETHLSREIERILNRLERLQRMRRGQPLPPQIDVKIA